MAMLVVLGLCLLFLGWLLGKPYYVEYRRKRLRRQSFPAEWQATLQQYVPLYRLLPAVLQKQMQGHVQVFLAEKKFIGCAGLAINDEMRVVIAAQACLLLLGRKTDYFPGLDRILLYPSTFVVDKLEEDEAGVLSSWRDELAGESWGDGQVLLSWQDVLEDSMVLDGRNVVIHEFAHQLDQQSGAANGAPILARLENYREWAATMTAEYDRLRAQADAGQYALFDYYGAEHPAEFFAVVSEVFFEQPQEMAELHPDLYAQLRGYYRVDPLQWHTTGAE